MLGLFRPLEEHVGRPVFRRRMLQFSSEGLHLPFVERDISTLLDFSIQFL
jgi:hypothetical protein